MDKKVFENLYSFNVQFDDIAPLNTMQEKFSYDLTNELYLYTDCKKFLTQESEDNTVMQNHLKSFLHGKLLEEYTKN